MDEELKAIIEDYYVALGFEYNGRSRESHQVKARAALMSALAEHRKVSHVGKAFGKDHATVIHHKSKHDGNLMYWDGYKENYEIAKRMCDYTLRYRTIQGKLRRINEEIRRLESIKNKLTEKLKNYEQLQIQNN